MTFTQCLAVCPPASFVPNIYMVCVLFVFYIVSPFPLAFPLSLISLLNTVYLADTHTYYLISIPLPPFVDFSYLHTPYKSEYY